jgi:hypothetical protein
MRVRLTGSFVLAGSLSTVLPVFTAEGERQWAPGWEPVWADEAHDDMLAHWQDHTSRALA